MASGQTVTVPIPRPRPDRPGERTTQVPLEPGESEKDVVMPSLHNWVEQVYAAFEQTFPTGANELVLLGVREASRTAGETDAADTEDDYTTSTRPADRGEQGAKGDLTTTFNDLLFMVWTESTPEENTRARVYGCTIDPSIDSSGTTGSPYLIEGKAYKAVPGRHKSGRGLIVFNESGPTKIMLAREATKSSRVFRDIESALTPPSGEGPGRWEFVGLHTNNTIHIHWSMDYTADRLTKNWSAGCTVMAHDDTSDVYAEFLRLTEAAANRSEIPYLVVSSTYVNLPDVWATSNAETPAQLEDPAYTVRAGGLVRAPSPLAGYLPSIMTFDFAQQVLRLAGDVDKLSAAVGGGDPADLDASLANVLDIEQKYEALPRSVPAGLGRWSTAKNDGQPFPDEERASLLEGLSGLGANLRNSITRACFTTVLPTERGPR